MVFRYDQGTWVVQVGGTRYSVLLSPNGDLDCSPTVLKIDSQAVRPEDEQLAWELAKWIDDEAIRLGLKLPPGCGCIGR